MQRLVAVAAFFSLVTAAAAATTDKGIVFAPYKDDLFAYPKILSSNADGSRFVVDFDPKRDVDGRDAVPIKQATPDRVSTDVDAEQKDLVLNDSGRSVPFVEVGDMAKKAKFAFIFVHGAGGNRFQGVDDNTFGGNFNRAKNLVVKAGGLYLSPGLVDQTDKGASEVKMLMQEFATYSPGAPIYVACSSNGGRLCMRLLLDQKAQAMLGGVFFLGAITSTGIFGTTVPKSGHVPIYIGVGNSDTVVGWHGGQHLYDGLKKRDPNYPVRLVIFNTGKHGTPMRMIDWRAELTWMVAAGGVH